MASKLWTGGSSVEIVTPLEGEWWLPAHPDAVVAGILRIEDDQIDLTILGKIPRIWDFAAALNPEVIIGTSVAGHQITLFQCSPHGGREALGGPKAVTFRARFMLSGLHFGSLADAVPIEVRARFSNLEEWLGQDKILTDFRSWEAGELPRPLLSVQKELASSDEFDIFVAVNSEATSSWGKLELEDKGAIIFRAKNGVPLLSYLPVVRAFRALLTLAMSCGVSLCGLKAVFAVGLPGEEMVEHPIALPVTGGAFRMGVASSTSSRGRLLFSLPDLGDSGPLLVSQWVKFYANFKPIIDLYGFTAYRSDLILEERFLNVIKICESFHRSEMSSAEAVDDAHAKRLSDIMASVPDEHSNWLRHKLKHSNEPHLAKRLEKLLDFAGSEITELLPVGRKKLVDAAAAGRNFLTHFSDEAKSKAPPSEELPSLARWWLLIFEACLLLHAGLPRVQVVEFFRRSRYRNGDRFFESRNIEYRQT